MTSALDMKMNESDIRNERSGRKLRQKRTPSRIKDRSTTSLSNNGQSISLLPPRIKQTTNPPVLLEGKLTRKRRLPHKHRERLKDNQKQLQDADMEKWLETTGRFPETQWRIKEKRSLRSWFDRLDRDHSGEIDVEELADPLLSTGLAKSMSEVKSLIRRVDEDNSNGIGFKEFLTVMKTKKDRGSDKVRGSNKKIKRIESNSDNQWGKEKARRKKRANKWTNLVAIADYSRHAKPKKKKALNPIVQLTERENDGSMDISSSLCWERRKLLLDATMGEAERRQRAFEKVQRWRGEMKQMKGVAKFKKLRDIAKVVQQMEVNQAEKENVVQAMKGVLIRALDPNSNMDIVCPMKTAAHKDSIIRRNVKMLTKNTSRTNRNGGRHVIAYPRTRTPSIPTILGIHRKGSLTIHTQKK